MPTVRIVLLIAGDSIRTRADSYRRFRLRPREAGARAATETFGSKRPPFGGEVATFGDKRPGSLAVDEFELPALRLGSMAEDVHITPEGLEAVQKEHEELTTNKRPAIVAKIKAARELGDLSENFEYHAAKNEQGMMEARIRELEAIIKNHVLIETRSAAGVVNMGSTVRFTEDDADEETYRIVGPAEADPKAGRVSYESAVGKALIGHRVGDEVEIKTPGGRYTVRITAIE
jgi:transcription elongation factor GreA